MSKTIDIDAECAIMSFALFCWREASRRRYGWPENGFDDMRARSRHSCAVGNLSLALAASRA